MKTAREALEYIKEVSTSPNGGLVIPLMAEYLIKHFSEGKGLDDVLEIPA